MNKIYKVIWSKVKHQYVVVSELAHSNGKQNSKSERTTVSGSLRALAAALVVSGSLLAMPYTASAAEGDVYYQLQNGDEVINIEENDLSSYFKIAEKQADGTYTINGQIVANEYLYDIDFNGDGKTEVGAFVVNDNIYTGDVYNQNHDVVIPEVQHTITNEDGFYASNGKGTYNSLTKDGLWVGGTKDGEGFHVDNDGNVRTTENMMVDKAFYAGDRNFVVDEDGNLSAAGGNFTIDKDGTTYAHAGRSELQVTENQAVLRHGDNGVIVNEDGVAVAGELTADNGLKAGLVGYDEEGNAIYGAQMGQDGSLSAAQGSFKVDAEGNVSAADGNFTVDKDGTTYAHAGRSELQVT
ncbi:ESPR domain-containing protein, partial [Megamonas hypermegale]|uniref:ESPR domain-containing protein n=1 Tax=Megamonas hypermegale TaxID=158847 RepID=UPI0026EDE43B